MLGDISCSIIDLLMKLIVPVLDILSLGSSTMNCLYTATLSYSRCEQIIGGEDTSGL